MKTPRSTLLGFRQPWLLAAWLGLMAGLLSAQGQGIRSATATAVVADGYVVGVTLVDGGSGYGVAPTVTFPGGGGSGAVAVAKVRNGMVDRLILVCAGSGYSASTVVEMTPPQVPRLESVRQRFGLTIQGRVGAVHQIQATEVLRPAAWQVVAEVVVTNSPYVWMEEGMSPAQRYYRVAAAAEIPVLGAKLRNELTIQGTGGTTNWVLGRDGSTSGTWSVLTNFVVGTSPYVWVDQEGMAGRTYQVATTPEVPVSLVEPRDLRRWVWIAPGRFTMSSPPNEVDRFDWEGPQTAVTITKGFWMGKYEVTQGEYQAVTGSIPSSFIGDPNRPVEQVSWNDAVIYCARFTERERLAGRIPLNCVYRLPTEAEWEYACRAWTSTRFYYGDDPGYTNLSNYAWYGAIAAETTHPVGQKLPNPWGLYDMNGNVCEWCQDWWSYYYPGGIVVDPQGPATGPFRVVRNGIWPSGGADCRSADRSGASQDTRYKLVGFRVLLAPGQP